MLMELGDANFKFMWVLMGRIVTVELLAILVLEKF